MDLESEGFIIKNKEGVIVRDGIGSSAKAARSAIGLTGKGEIFLVAVSGNGKGKGLTIFQLSDLMKYLKSVEAMALDGGSSTGIAWKDKNKWNTFFGTGTFPAIVNSALIVKP
jgi:exopolysaccharide biosynthesis protein